MKEFFSKIVQISELQLFVCVQVGGNKNHKLFPSIEKCQIVLQKQPLSGNYFLSNHERASYGRKRGNDPRTFGFCGSGGLKPKDDSFIFGEGI